MMDTIFSMGNNVEVCCLLEQLKSAKEHIEITIDTVEEERRKGLATIASAALILRCLDEGLYPSWDAQNMKSVRLAEKLGYEFDHEYTAYEVSMEYRTH